MNRNERHAAWGGSRACDVKNRVFSSCYTGWKWRLLYGRLLYGSTTYYCCRSRPRECCQPHVHSSTVIWCDGCDQCLSVRLDTLGTRRCVLRKRLSAPRVLWPTSPINNFGCDVPAARSQPLTFPILGGTLQKGHVLKNFNFSVFYSQAVSKIA